MRNEKLRFRLTSHSPGRKDAHLINYITVSYRESKTSSRGLRDIQSNLFALIRRSPTRVAKLKRKDDFIA